MNILFPSQNHVNPAMDFTQTPPGMLALDNMLYFAKQHQDAYIRVSSQRLPSVTGFLPNATFTCAGVEVLPSDAWPQIFAFHHSVK